MQVSEILRVGEAFLPLAAACSGGSLLLKAVICAEGFIWVGELRVPTAPLTLLVSRFPEPEAAGRAAEQMPETDVPTARASVGSKPAGLHVPVAPEAARESIVVFA